MLRNQVKTAFNKAVSDEANWSDGKINWNFVEADIFLDIKDSVKLAEEIIPIFNELADKFMVDMPVEFC